MQIQVPYSLCLCHFTHRGNVAPRKLQLAFSLIFWTANSCGIHVGVISTSTLLPEEASLGKDLAMISGRIPAIKTSSETTTTMPLSCGHKWVSYRDMFSCIQSKSTHDPCQIVSYNIIVFLEKTFIYEGHQGHHNLFLVLRYLPFQLGTLQSSFIS